MTADTIQKPAPPRRNRQALRDFIALRVADELGAQMLNVALGWRAYAATHDPMSLAYIGLAQFLPNVAMVLVAGQAADHFDRRKIIAFSLFAQAALLAGFAAWSAAVAPPMTLAYFLLFAIGAVRAFSAPAMSAMLPSLVGGAEFPRAVAVVSWAFQASAIIGPALGGLLYAVSGSATFIVAAALYLAAAIKARRLPTKPGAPGDRECGLTNDKGLLAGFRAILSNRLLLALISLDLFAVLLGGVTALLPIYAKDILGIGPFGLGCLRCAPGVGAAIVGLILARFTIRRGAGRMMLGGVAGFALSTVVFALSRNVWLSVGALLAAGGFDMISMVVRQTLIQVSTPDAMRGRVSAVNWVFIGASAELGEFESGLAAAFLGAVPAALLGGLGTLTIVALWAVLFPQLRRADQLTVAETNDAGAIEQQWDNAGQSGERKPFSRSRRAVRENKIGCDVMPCCNPCASCPALCRASTPIRSRKFRKFVAAARRGWPGQARP